MFILGRFMEAVAFILGLLLSTGLILVIGRVVVSWLQRDQLHPLSRFLSSATEPVFSLVRQRIPLRYAGLDLTPMFVILIIFFLQIFLVQSLEDFARKLHDVSFAGKQEAY